MSSIFEKFKGETYVVKAIIILDLVKRISNRSVHCYLIEADESGYTVVKDHELRHPVFLTRVDRDSEECILTITQNPYGRRTDSYLSMYDSYDIAVISDIRYHNIEMSGRVNIDRSKLDNFICVVFDAETSKDQRINAVVETYIKASTEDEDGSNDEDEDIDTKNVIDQLIQITLDELISSKGGFNSLYEGYAYLLESVERLGGYVNTLLRGMKITWTNIKNEENASTLLFALNRNLRVLSENIIASAIVVAAQIDRFARDFSNIDISEFDTKGFLSTFEEMLGDDTFNF